MSALSKTLVAAAAGVAYGLVELACVVAFGVAGPRATPTPTFEALAGARSVVPALAQVPLLVILWFQRTPLWRGVLAIILSLLVVYGPFIGSALLFVDPGSRLTLVRETLPWLSIALLLAVWSGAVRFGRRSSN